MTEQAEEVEIDQEHKEQPAQQVVVARQRQEPIPTGGAIQAVIPRDVSQAGRLALAIIRAGLCPDSYKDDDREVMESKVLIGILKSLEVGFAPITGLSTIAIINGRPCIYGDGVVALLQKSGSLERRVDEEIGDVPGEGDLIGTWPDTYGIRVRLFRHGQGEPYEGIFTVGMAKRAGLWMNVRRKPWIQYPRRMLTWRAFSLAARDGFADCLSGLSIREEVEDMPAATSKAPDTSFLDDDATPEALPLSAPEEAGDEADPLDIPAFLDRRESKPDDEPPSARVPRLGDDTASWTDWIKAMAAAVKASESEAELDALLDDPGNASDMDALAQASQGNHHRLMQAVQGRVFELEQRDRPGQAEAEHAAEAETEPEPDLEPAEA